MLKELGLADYEVRKFRGRPFAQWRLSEQLGASRSSANRFDPNGYFAFPVKLLHGGNWSRMSGSQRLLYLGLGTMATTVQLESLDDFLGLSIRPGTNTSDITRSSRGEPGREWVRLACASFGELHRATGLPRPSLVRTVAGIKHPGVWRESGNAARALAHLPISVYPSVPGYSSLYHFRDHATPWPMLELNEGGRPVDDCSEAEAWPF